MLISFNFSAVRMPIISSAVESSVNWGRQSRRTLLSYSAPAIPNGGKSILARKSAFGIAMPARKWRIVRLGKHFKARTTYERPLSKFSRVKATHDDHGALRPAGKRRH
jgi:hypothetical protein